MNNYKNLDVWKDSVNLVTEIYTLTNEFPNREKFGLISQINRSAVSIPSNIAEGAGRLSEKSFIQFLGYAIASGYELETQLIVAVNLSLINNDQKENVLSKLTVVLKKLYNLIKSLKKNIRK